jgi:hypothetical protein
MLRAIESGPGARPALTIITCEVDGHKRAENTEPNLAREHRAYAEAIRTLFLGPDYVHGSSRLNNEEKPQ